MARIFDDPNHRHYGPVRRLWIVLVHLDLLHARFERGFENHYGLTWDECMANGCANGALSESQLARLIVRRMLAMV